MKLLRTIRGQLTLYFVLVFGVMLGIFSIILYNIYANQNRQELDESMIILAKSIDEEMQSEGIRTEILDETKETYIPFTPNKQILIEILEETGKVILKSPKLGKEDLPFEKEWMEKSILGNGIFKTIYKGVEESLWDSYGLRILIYPVNFRENNYTVIIGVPLSNLEETLFSFRLILFIAIPLTLLLASLTGWMFSKRAYAPVTEIIKNANSITANNLESRLVVNDTGDEISKLALTLNSMIERLQNSFTVLKQFTADASHELRTPLTILKGEIEVALNSDRSADEYERVLKNNLEEVGRLQKIVEGLLTLSQIESNKNPVFNENINLEELLTEAVTKVNNLAKKKNIRIILKLYETGENGFKRIYVKGDSAKLLNVFLNLLDNAVKYSHVNDEVICLEKYDSSENKVIVSIKDNGLGIADTEAEKIFDRFYRSNLSRTRDESNGIGLGLAIAKAAIEAHQGNISIISKSGKGTTFVVTLPGITEKESKKTI